MPWLAETSRRASDLLARHDPGVHVRQQRRFLQHQRAHLAQIADGRLVPEFGQRLTRRAVAQFRLVAEGEQGLGAAGGFAGAGDGQDFVGRQIRGVARPRPFGKRAVVADVTTQLGQRDEDFPGVGDIPPERLVALMRRLGHQVGQRHGFQPGHVRFHQAEQVRFGVRRAIGHGDFRTASSAKRCWTSSVAPMVGCGDR